MSTGLVQRSKYPEVGDTLINEDLCIGLYGGSNYKVGTCTLDFIKKAALDSIKAEDIIIKNNHAPINATAISAMLDKLSSDTQAQCVMVRKENANATCWEWNSSLTECIQRCDFLYGKTDAECTQCVRTRPIPSEYAVYVRSSEFDKRDDRGSSTASLPMRQQRLSVRLLATIAVCAISILA